MTNLTKRAERISRLSESVTPYELISLYRAADAVSAAESAAAHAKAETRLLRYALRDRAHFAERGDENPTEVFEAALAMLIHFSGEGGAAE